MLKIDIPQRGTLELHHAVFDINGTLAVDGVALSGVAERLQRLSEHLSIHLLTADTHGTLATLRQTLNYPLQLINKGDEKMRYVQELGPENVIAFGNGVNDAGMLRLAAVGIAILANEGVSVRALQAADVLTRGPLDALDLVLRPTRLIATLRG